MSRPIRVEIMGQTFSVVSDEGEEHVRQVAAYVDRLMREQAPRAASSFAAAVITALNIASEYQKLTREHGRVQKTIDRLVDRLGVATSTGFIPGGKEIDSSGRAEGPAPAKPVERLVGGSRVG